MGDLATTADVSVRLGRELTDGEETRAVGLLAEASALVVGYLGYDPSLSPPIPAPVGIITSRMVARVLERAKDAPFAGADSLSVTAGPFSKQATFPTGSGSGGPWLTSADKTTLAPYRQAGVGSISGVTDWDGRFRGEHQ